MGFGAAVRKCAADTFALRMLKWINGMIINQLRWYRGIARPYQGLGNAFLYAKKERLVTWKF